MLCFVLETRHVQHCPGEKTPSITFLVPYSLASFRFINIPFLTLACPREHHVDQLVSCVAA
jgi:hypothetical protein